jgi:hypothetical protein
MTHSVQALRRALAELTPIHDTPIGVVHPYWARKPLNVVETVIEHLSTTADTVADPFMGSGTTVFAALKNGRNAIGGDINVLSHFVVESLLDVISSAEEIIPELERILTAHRELTLPWFRLANEQFVERARYSVEGEFAHGGFRLTLTEVVTKTWANGRWGHRRVYSGADMPEWSPAHNPVVAAYSNKLVDFERIVLQPNSRIAIPKGANLGQYFTLENQASINALLALIEASPLYERHSVALRLILSSSLPLLRLSDPKASSQWPYWRPKANLTSRNAVPVLHERFKQLRALAEWGAVNIKALRAQSDSAHEYQLFTVAAQKLNLDLVGRQVDLVLTDPPYGDQVPYVEYSSLWTGILGLREGADTLALEVVKSDAEHRKSDSIEYQARLSEAFLANANILRQGGHLVWFYQDQDLACWNAIHAASLNAGLTLSDVIPIPKQRRSLKTVTSPNTTLDGDLLCIYVKRKPEHVDQGSPEAAFERLREAVRSCSGTYFDQYAVLINLALTSDLIAYLASEYGTVKKALKALNG